MVFSLAVAVVVSAWLAVALISWLAHEADTGNAALDARKHAAMDQTLSVAENSSYEEAFSVQGCITHELRLLPPNELPIPPLQAPLPGKIGDSARLAIVIDDLGENMNAVRQLLRLPYPVTFAILPRSSHARESAEAGHAAGRQIIVHQPMEPLGYPERKSVLGVLQTGDSSQAIEQVLQQSFAAVPHAVGLNNHMGSRFTQNNAAARAVVSVVKERNLFVLDSVTHPASVLYAQARRHGVPSAKRDIFLDVTQTKEAVLAQLLQAEKLALLTGRAVAIGHPHAETLAALQEWAGIRNRQVEAVPLRALMEP